jgi:hypothetical protein
MQWRVFGRIDGRPHGRPLIRTLSRPLGGRDRRSSHSRPSVVRAAAAAHAARAALADTATLGSAWVGASAAVVPAHYGPDAPARQSSAHERGAIQAAPVIAWAGEGADSVVEDVWTAALAAWITGEGAERQGPHAGSDRGVRRRQHMWADIDDTLGAMRAS